MARLNPLHDIVSSQWIFDARRESLSLLFARHPKFFRGFIGYEKEALHSHDWKVQAHRALLHSQRPLPAPLAVALIQLVQVSGPEAHRAFLEIAATERIDLGPQPELLGANDVAILFYVLQPRHFFQVLARFTAEPGDVEGRFSASSAEELHLMLTFRRLDRLRHSLVAYRATSSCSRYLAVQRTSDEEEIRFHLARGILSHTFRTRTAEAAVTRLKRPFQLHYATVTYVRREHCLRIRCQSESELRLLAERFGMVFHRRSDYFRRSGLPLPQTAA